MQVRAVRVVPDWQRKDRTKVCDRLANERRVGNGGHDLAERDGRRNSTVHGLQERLVALDRIEAVREVSHRGVR